MEDSQEKKYVLKIRDMLPEDKPREKLLSDGYYSRIKLKNFVLGAIKYIDFQNPHEIDLLKNEIKFTPFMKDKSFIHENEFRMMAEIEKIEQKPLVLKSGISKYYQEKFHKEHQINGLDISINNFYEYKFEIVYNPKISNWVRDDIEKILEKFEIPFKTRDSKLKLK